MAAGQVRAVSVLSPSSVMLALERIRKREPRCYAKFRDLLIDILCRERARDFEREETWWLDARDNLRDRLDDRQRRSSGAASARRGTEVRCA